METTIKQNVKIEITEEDFKDYVSVQESGLTNMYDVNKVVELSNNLTSEKVKAIIENYEALMLEFPNVRNS